MSAQKRRSRAIIVHSSQGIYSLRAGGTSYPPSTETFTQTAYQQTISEGHNFRNTKKLRGHYDIQWLKAHGWADFGGTFDTRTATCIPGLQIVDADTDPSGTLANRRRYQGPYFAYKRNLSYGPAQLIPPSSPGSLDALGTHAIAVTIPTNPLAGMGVFLGELRDLPRAPFMDSVRNMKERIKHFRKVTKGITKGLSRDAANEYLNGVFGWAPFISDLKKFHKVVKNHQRYIDQFQKGSGQLIRRRYNSPETSTSTYANRGAYPGNPQLDTYMYDHWGTLFLTTTVKTLVWFSGAFTYYLPKVDSFMGKAKHIDALGNHLYGTRVTPDLLYKLAPWSWALDWVTNTGDLIHNWSAFQNDGLVMQYGYVMEKKTTTNTYTLLDVKLVNVPPLTLTQTEVFETKTRRRATPYGFGLNASSFTNKQWSIIAALGISKAPRSLIF